jgi:hypothetical protein
MTAALPPIHRVVTGHDAHGKALVSQNGALPTVIELSALPGTVFHEVWSTQGAPCLVSNGADPTLSALMLPPPALGTRIRFVDIPPDTTEFLRDGVRSTQAAFAEIGDASASTAQADSPHPLMHRTETVDYGVVIRRGTNHAWANRSDRPCRMLFVLVDGRYDPALAGVLHKA